MFMTSNRHAEGFAAVFAASLAVAACSTAPGERIVSGGEFGADAAIVGPPQGDAGKGVIIGGAAPDALSTAYPPQYGSYDYRTHSYGGYGFSTRCVRLSPYTGHCAEWRRS